MASLSASPGMTSATDSAPWATMSRHTVPHPTAILSYPSNPDIFRSACSTFFPRMLLPGVSRRAVESSVTWDSSFVGRLRGVPVINARGSSKRSRGWDDSSDGGGGGHSEELQRMLVDMVRLQVGEARMNSLVEERSQRMRRIAMDSHEQLDRIASRAMRGVDDFSIRVLRQMDAGAHAIERDLEQARRDMEAQKKELEEFERRTLVSRNEGLFFKNLYSPAYPRSRPRPRSRSHLPSRPLYAQHSRQPLRSLASTSPAVAAPADDEEQQQHPERSSAYRRILHVGIALVLVSFLWSSSSALVSGQMMRSSKVLAYSAIFSALLLQLKYEKTLVGDDAEAEDAGSDREGDELQ